MNGSAALGRAEALDLMVGTDKQYGPGRPEEEFTPVWSLYADASVAIPADVGIVVDRTAAATAFLRWQARMAIDAISRFDYHEARARAGGRGYFAVQRAAAVANADLRARSSRPS